MSFYIFGLVTYDSPCTSTGVFASVSRIKCVIILYVIIILIYNYTYNRVSSICIVLIYPNKIIRIRIPWARIYLTGHDSPG